MSSHANRKIICFGLGFTSLSLCDRLLDAGWEIAGTVRTEQKANLLRSKGIRALIFNGLEANPAVGEAIRESHFVLNSVPVLDAVDPVLEEYGAEIANSPNLKWFAYLSTTVVYGDHDGAWVNEETDCVPSGKRGRNRLATEEAWAKLNLPLHVFRLAGIYGPASNEVETIKAGKAKGIDKAGQVLSRIHVHDIASTLIASMDNPTASPGHPEIFNLCDDEPCEPRAVIEYGCELLNVAPPPLVPYEDANLSPMGRSFYDDNKRVSNDKIKEVLGVKLRYPNYRIALDELVRQ